MSPMYMKALAHAAQLGQLDIRCGEPRVVARPSGTAADGVCEAGSGSLSVVIEPDPLRKMAGEEKHEQPSEMDGPGRGAADFDKVLLGTGNTTNCRALPLLRDLLDNVKLCQLLVGCRCSRRTCSGAVSLCLWWVSWPGCSSALGAPTLRAPGRALTSSRPSWG